MTTPLLNVGAVKGSRMALPLLLLVALLAAPTASFAGVTYTWIPSDGSPSSGTLTIDAPGCGGFSVSQTAVSAFTFTFAPGLSVDLSTAQRVIAVDGQGEVIPIVSSDGSRLVSGLFDLRLLANPGIRVFNSFHDTFPSISQYDPDPSGQNLVVRGNWERALDEFAVGSGDMNGLIAAIDGANSSGRDSRIHLEAGTYRLTASNNSTDGPNGLPSITGNVLITGPGQETTILERERGAPPFRLMHVAGTGCLALQGLTLKGGDLDIDTFGGGGIFNRGELGLSSVSLTENGFIGAVGGIRNEGGVLTIARSSISHNTGDGGGGIRNSSSGRVAITDTLITDNAGGRFGGGVWNAGELSLTRSTISNNSASLQGGAGIYNSAGSLVIRQSSLVGNRTVGTGGGLRNLASATVSDTTVANNVSGESLGIPGGGGVSNARGTVMFVNSTIVRNRAEVDLPDAGVAGGGGIQNEDSGVVRLQNTIVALNTTTAAPGIGGSDCHGVITSIARNLIGDPAGCTVSLGSTDLVGDPGLGAFIDSGAPGTARVPLLATSRAVDARGPCSGNDQLDTPRLGACDIGAVEFYPVIDDVVALDVLSTAFDPTPVPGGPAGTLRISVKYTNNSGTTIAPSFVEVSELSGHNLLLNASRSLFGPDQAAATGGVGARVSLGNNGFPASRFFDLVVGLATREPFRFFVNVYGAVKHDDF